MKEAGVGVGGGRSKAELAELLRNVDEALADVEDWEFELRTGYTRRVFQELRAATGPEAPLPRGRHLSAD